MRNVITSECRYKEIAVVIAGLHSNFHCLASFVAGCLQQFGFKLFNQKVIGITLIHKNMTGFFAGFDQFNRVVVRPGSLVATKITR